MRPTVVGTAGVLPVCYDITLGRSCGAVTTTRIVPSPRPSSARRTPRLGPSSHAETELRVGDRGAPEGEAPPERRRSSLTVFRENWVEPPPVHPAVPPRRSPKKVSTSKFDVLRRPLRHQLTRPVDHFVDSAHRPATASSATAGIQRDGVGALNQQHTRSAEESRTPRTRLAAVPLSADQRRRARVIMLREDAEAAAFVAASQSFDPVSVVSRARALEQVALQQKIQAAEAELMWAKFRKEHVQATIQDCAARLDAIKSERQNCRPRPSSDHPPLGQSLGSPADSSRVE